MGKEFNYMTKSGWSHGLKPEFYPGNQGLPPARVNHRKKTQDHLCALNGIDLQGVPEKNQICFFSYKGLKLTTFFDGKAHPQTHY